MKSHVVLAAALMLLLDWNLSHVYSLVERHTVMLSEISHYTNSGCLTKFKLHNRPSQIC